MLQLSALPSSSPEMPAKMPAGGASGDAFAALLAGGAADGEKAGGKILPEGGKALPDGLPEQGDAARAMRALAAAFAAKGQARPARKPAEALPAANPLPMPGEAGKGGKAAKADQTSEPGEAAVPAIPQEPALLAVVALPPAGVSPAGAQEEGAASALDNGGRHAGKAVPAPAAGAAKQGREAGIAVPGHPAPADSGNGAEGQEKQKQPGDRSEGRESSRPARAAPARLARELKIDLPGAEKAPAGGDVGGGAGTGTARTGQAGAIVLPLAPAHTDALHGGHGARAGLDGAGRPDSIRPQDFTMLVDRLVEARESARAGSASISLMHSDFGEVSLRFTHDHGGLTVSMANADPDFARAVNAAAPADGSQAGDSAMQGGRRDDGGAGLFARTDSGAGAGAGEGGGAWRGGTGDGLEQADVQDRAADKDGKAAMGGIFA